MTTQTVAPPSMDAAFDIGKAEGDRENYREALPHFQAMLEALKQQNEGKPAKFSEPPHQSYYALCMTMVYGPSREAIQLSERAVSREFYNPDLYCNLGLVYMRCGKRGPAFRAFRRGLALKPSHQRIGHALAKYEMRQRRIFSFLTRGNILNRLVGMLRFRFNGDD